MNEQPEEINQENQLQPADSGQNETTNLHEPISWQATEATHEARGMVWYTVFAVIVAGLMALAIFVFQSITFAILLPVMAVAVIVLSIHPPAIIVYSVSPKGVYVADKLYDFSEFRAFGVIREPRGDSIILLPVKRFSPGATLYFKEEDGEKIVDMLGARLPIQEVKPDGLERFIRFIRL